MVPEAYYVIKDISQPDGAQKPLQVVAQYDNEAEARKAKAGLEVRGCEVFVEVGGNLYRVICPVEKVESNYKE